MGNSVYKKYVFYIKALSIFWLNMWNQKAISLNFFNKAKAKISFSKVGQIAKSMLRVKNFQYQQKSLASKKTDMLYECHNSFCSKGMDTFQVLWTERQIDKIYPLI